MKTDELIISQDPQAISDALDKIELIALYTGMSRKEATSMRLLAEELLSATKSILDAYQGRLWMETTNEEFALHLSVMKPNSKAEREQLIALSKTGAVTPPSGLFSRLGAALSNFFSVDDDGLSADMFTHYTMFADMMRMEGAGYTYHYLPTPDEFPQKELAKPVDELAGIEKSIIETIVDDILVTVKSDNVEIIAIKKLK